MKIQKPKVRRYQLGSKGHSRTMLAVHEYHKAKAKGKQCLIVAKTEQEKFRLAVNHKIDPADIVLHSEVRGLMH